MLHGVSITLDTVRIVLCRVRIVVCAGHAAHPTHIVLHVVRSVLRTVHLTLNAEYKFIP